MMICNRVIDSDDGVPSGSFPLINELIFIVDQPAIKLDMVPLNEYLADGVNWVGHVFLQDLLSVTNLLITCHASTKVDVSNQLCCIVRRLTHDSRASDDAAVVLMQVLD